jgi:hypothetical protein
MAERPQHPRDGRGMNAPAEQDQPSIIADRDSRASTTGTRVNRNASLSSHADAGSEMSLRPYAMKTESEGWSINSTPTQSLLWPSSTRRSARHPSIISLATRHARSRMMRWREKTNKKSPRCIRESERLCTQKAGYSRTPRASSKSCPKNDAWLNCELQSVAVYALVMSNNKRNLPA